VTLLSLLGKVVGTARKIQGFFASLRMTNKKVRMTNKKVTAAQGQNDGVKQPRQATRAIMQRISEALH
jgi:hypothetical protein